MRGNVVFVLTIALIMSFTLTSAAQEAWGKGNTEDSKTSAKTEKKAVEPETSPNPMVVLQTNYGDITLELFKKEAPISVENFLRYVREGFYDNTIFHRVVKGFVLQAGGMTKDLKQKKQHEPIKNEATNGLSNKRGTISMARTSAINSATSHFFINLVDNTRLDHRGEDPASYGYAVFGKVAKGMDVVDKIANVKVTTKGRYQNVPVEPVVIKKAYVVGDKTEDKTKQEQLKKEANKLEEK